MEIDIEKIVADLLHENLATSVTESGKYKFVYRLTLWKAVCFIFV